MSIDTSDITTVSIDGSGVFDVLMKVTTTHLEQEFKAGRITGANYSNVYLSGLQAVLAQSVAYALGKEQADAQTNVLIQQAANLEVERQRSLKEVEKTTAEVALLQKQLEIAGITLQNLQKEGEQLTANTLLTEANTANATKQGTILDLQADRTEEETNLVRQRVVSEEAQTQSTVNGNEVTGVLGKQINLYQAQTDGFARDAEQKLLRGLTDMWNTAKATDATNEILVPLEANNDSINSIIVKMKEGIGL